MSRRSPFLKTNPVRYIMLIQKIRHPNPKTVMLVFESPAARKKDATHCFEKPVILGLVPMINRSLRVGRSKNA